MARAAARSASAARQGPVTLAVQAMACRFEIVLSAGDGADDDPARLRAVGEEALAEVKRCDAMWSLFRRDSVLARLNRQAARAPVRIDPETFELLRLCVEVYEASGGAFDPTVAAWMRAHRLHRDSCVGAADPDATGMDGVLFGDDGSVSFSRSGLALDLGAVAKGAALDLAAAVLREHGVSCALLHGGTSTVIALGAPPGQPAWRVGVAGAGGMPTVKLRDAALSVSAPHGRSVPGPDGEVTHVLDPRTGRSASGRILSAVVAERAAVADAWSTALLVGDTAIHGACPGAALVADDAGGWTTDGGEPPPGCSYTFS